MSEGKTAINSLPKKPECDHKGHYRALGVIQLPSTSGIMLMAIMFCQNCGTVKNETMKIKSMVVSNSPLTLPKIMPGRKPN